MAPRYDLIASITPVRECWRVRVRVVRLWYLPTFNNAETLNSIEMVFMDDNVSWCYLYFCFHSYIIYLNLISGIIITWLWNTQGASIHASVRKTLIYKFKPVLNEGEVYVVAFFSVAGNTGLYRTTRHEFRLNFQLRTTVRRSECDTIPLYGLNLVPLEDIFQTDGDFPYLIGTFNFDLNIHFTFYISQ